MLKNDLDQVRTSRSIAILTGIADWKRKKAVSDCNDNLIRDCGIDAHLKELSDPADPSEYEIKYLLAYCNSSEEMKKIKRESFPELCRRLSANYEALRKRAQRQKQKPNQVIKRSRGRPTKEEENAKKFVVQARINTARAAVRYVYAKVGKVIGKMGGDTSNGPMYGELTEHSMEKVCEFLATITEMKDQRFLDIGSGINKPALHVAAHFSDQIKSAIGIEYMAQRNALAGLLGGAIINDIIDGKVVHKIAPFNNIHLDAMSLTDLFQLKFGVLFGFSTAYDAELIIKIGQLWNLSSATILILFENFKELESMGFKYLRFRGKFAVKMTGGEGKTVYFYSRCLDHGSKRRLANLPSPEAKIKRAIDICECGDRNAFLAFTEAAYEDGLRTSIKVSIGDGKFAARSIRKKVTPDRLSF